jgi:hypothetical protein
MYHVDEVYVLNHSSTDGTYQGTRRLQQLWPGRLHVVEYHDNHFWQEACLSALIEVSQRSSPDWIYVFDADEFMIVGQGRSLREILREVDPDYSVVRYQVQNWISTEDFDEGDLDCYRMLRYRSMPNRSISLPYEARADAIRNGEVSFYDLAFMSKVIFRNMEGLWVAAGTHTLKAPSKLPVLELKSDVLRVVHLPLLSRSRLDGKARTGQLKVQDHFPAWHGWQNQMMWRLSQEGRLDEFWQNHSIAAREKSESSSPTGFALDDSFVRAIEPVLRLFEDGFGSRVLQRGATQDSSMREPADSQIPFGTAVHACRKLQLIADSGQAAQLQLSCVYASSVWRISAPLRLVGRAWRRARERWAHRGTH